MATKTRARPSTQRSSGQTGRKNSGSSAGKSTSTASSTSRSTSAAQQRSSTSSRTTTSQANTGSPTGSGTTAQAKPTGPTITLPYVTAEFHRTDLRLPSLPDVQDMMPSREDVNSAMDTVRAQLPARDRAVFYGALAAGTVFSVIEWPVAVAIGVATELVSHQRSDANQE
ncbi:hypothetical protein [Allosaccharopolyspora coralli]|nr:hypothetical protein [Allosaccharopolyspora coralli]